jgi:hypothetical protein
LSDGATIEGMYLAGASFSLSVAKRAPQITIEGAG